MRNRYTLEYDSYFWLHLIGSINIYMYKFENEILKKV